jgi:hypothetical protein
MLYTFQDRVLPTVNPSHCTFHYVSAVGKPKLRRCGRRCGGHWGDEELGAAADEIYDGPEDLLEHLDASHLGSSAAK